MLFVVTTCFSAKARSGALGKDSFDLIFRGLNLDPMFVEAVLSAFFRGIWSQFDTFFWGDAIFFLRIHIQNIEHLSSLDRVGLSDELNPNLLSLLQ